MPRACEALVKPQKAGAEAHYYKGKLEWRHDAPADFSQPVCRVVIKCARLVRLNQTVDHEVLRHVGSKRHDGEDG
jgi:hypothetical protein